MANSETKSPAEERAERLEGFRSEWKDLSGRVSLAHLYDELEDVQGQIEGLARQIEGYRQRGYVYSGDWEGRAATARQRWPQRSLEARRILQQQARRLEGVAKDVEELCSHSRLSDGSLDRLGSQLDQLKSQMDSAERSVRGAYDALGEQLRELQAEFRPVEFMLDSLETCSFDLYPDEDGVAACKAVWTSGRDEPEGILFLTGGRLVFESREKKAIKKMLFVTTESELIQEKMWDAPIGVVTEVEIEDKRKFLSKKELLHLRFREPPAGLAGETTIQLKDATNEEWAGLIKRVQSGEIEADRVAAPEGSEEEAGGGVEVAPVKEIPTKCPTCGARLPAVVKGMRELACEYCDSLIRL